MVNQQDLAFLAAFSDAANAHDVERIVDYYAPDAVAISPVFGEVRGRAAIAQTWEQIFITMPDAQLGRRHLCHRHANTTGGFSHRGRASQLPGSLPV